MEVGGVGSSRRGGSWQLGRRSWLGREREGDKSGAGGDNRAV